MLYIIFIGHRIANIIEGIMPKRNFITGGAGFIGSNLTDRLLEKGEEVIVYDNFSTGSKRFLVNAKASSAFTLIQGDLLDLRAMTKAMEGCQRVWHLSANADVRFGLNHPRRDLEQNTIATHNVLEAMRSVGVAEIAFSSTGSVYGEPHIHPTPEDAPFPIQTSLYAASKLAGEGLIQAYSEGFGLKARIFRFVSVLGERYTHGHIFDFCRSLLIDPSRLRILGDGLQRKSYMYVGDCISAMFLAMDQTSDNMAVYNLGIDGFVTVNDSAATICRRMNVDPKIEYTGGERGWIGDSPFIWLDVSRIQKLGWQPSLDILSAVEKTVDWLLTNQWVFDTRK